MAPVVEKVAGEFAGRVRFLKVDTEKLPEVAGAFGIRSIPTLVVMLGDEVIDSSVGMTSEATLTRLAQKALDRSEGKSFGQRLKKLFSREQPTA
jgi:thioredoxin 1